MSSNENNRDNAKKPKFLVDFMLGRLAKWLRIFGYDALYADKGFSENLILTSLKDSRILLTRNNRLSRNRALKLILVKSDKFLEQAGQVASELKLRLSEQDLFSRCTFCNGELTEIKDPAGVKDKVPDYVFKTQKKFTSCLKCGRIYWPGTHYGLLQKQLRKAGLL